MFHKIKAQRLLLEYDDARSGSFDPLKNMGEDKFVVLGLVTTKNPVLESQQFIERRVREATRFLPLERLGISPQCGFASSILGNGISAADQRRKLERIVAAARGIWGCEGD